MDVDTLREAKAGAGMVSTSAYWALAGGMVVPYIIQYFTEAAQHEPRVREILGRIAGRALDDDHLDEIVYDGPYWRRVMEGEPRYCWEAIRRLARREVDRRWAMCGIDANDLRRALAAQLALAITAITGSEG